MKQDANWQRYASLSRRKYAGQYVVIVRGTLVGAGRDLQRLLRIARESYPREVPFVAKVRDPRKVCVL